MDERATANQFVCLISIADIVVEIVCSDVLLFDRLRQHYRLFLALDVAPSPSQIVLHVSLDARLQTMSSGGIDITQRDGKHYLTTPGCEGMIDIAAGIAQVKVASLHAILDIDYGLRIIYALLAFSNGGMLLHAAGIVRNGQAFLFCGESGSGKTTVARLSPDDLVLNDDLVLLLPQGDSWMVYATPFWNPSQVGTHGPHGAPLRVIVRLLQAKHVFIEPMPPGQSLAELIACAPTIIASTEQMYALIARGLNILQSIPIYRLHFLPDNSFWRVVEPLACKQK